MARTGVRRARLPARRRARPMRRGAGADENVPARERVLSYLADHGGSVEAPSGRGLTQEMAQALGYPELSALNSMLGRLERDRLITREVRGRRTYRIALTERTPASPRRPAPPRSGGEPASRALRQLEKELAHPRGLMRACILLLLDERPAHGYELIERLRPFGFERDDPSRIYRALRWLEEVGFVRAAWETPRAGPARRVFELTPEGRRALQVCAPALRERSHTLDQHLGRYDVERSPVTSRRRRPLDVIVEAKLQVTAADEASAERVVERAFARGRILGEGVAATGEVWVYEAAPTEGTEGT